MLHKQPFQTHNIEEDEVLMFHNAPLSKETNTKQLQNEQNNEQNIVQQEQEEKILVEDTTQENMEEPTAIPQPHGNRRRILGTILLSLAMLALGYWLGTSEVLKPKQIANAPITNAPIENLNQNPITEQTFTGIPISVVIDNGPNSLPQRGLEKAAIIWEALAEGDITRYLAVFTDQIPEIVGPIRSARTYLNSLANQYGGLFLHVGGNDLALEEIKGKQFSFTDVNEFYHTSTFYRDKKRKAPHNAFSTKQQLKQFIQSQHTSTSTVLLFPTSEIFSGGTTTTSITIPYYTTLTDIIEWNGTRWIKKRNGVVWKDETGVPLVFDTVVLLSVQDETGFHPTIPELRRYLFDLGGELLMLRDGVSINGQWKFSNSIMNFIDQKESALGVKQGKTLSILVPKSVYSRISFSLLR